jgi:hypothetical protein
VQKIHLEILVEEPSMEMFLAVVLPKFLPQDVTFKIYVHRGKADLLRKIESRLRGYRAWLPENHGIVILVDRDDDDCRRLKGVLEAHCSAAGIITKMFGAGERYVAVTRIAIEELEAWYFGNWPAVVRAFPKISSDVVRKSAFRSSDEIIGGTWEAFERVLQAKGYFRSGLRKVEAARRIGREFEPSEATSPSFECFLGALRELTEV